MAESSVLSQREIDALLNGDSTSDEPSARAPSAAAAAARKDSGHRIKLYDFRHPEKLSKEQLRGLQVMQQGVSNSLAALLSNRLRSPVESRLSAFERGIYEEYVAQIGTSGIAVIINMAPLTGYVMAAFGVDLAFGIIDRLLGGRGKRSKRTSDRDLTDIETALVRHIAMDIARSLVEPWARVADLDPDVTELALGPQLMHGVPPNEFVLTAWYEIRFGEQTGGISLCFPLNILEQILPKLNSQSMFDWRPARSTEAPVKIRDDQVLPMKVPLRVMLGKATIPAVDIANLEPGDVFVLDRETDEPLHMLIGDCERFVGMPGTRGRMMALQVSGIIDDDGWVKPFGGGEQ